MFTNLQKPIPQTANITYVAESEHDADRLRGQLDAPVRVRNRRYRVTVDGAAIEPIIDPATETAVAPPITPPAL